MLLKAFCVLTIAALALGVPHNVTIYSDYDQTGDSVTFVSKQADFTLWKPFLGTAKSYCVSPANWYSFREVDFEFQHGNWVPGCRNITTSLASAHSMRHLGPPDTSVEAITLYQGSTGVAAGGKELIIETPAGNNFGFVPIYFVLTGRTNWTAYSENNFSGNSTCLNSAGREYFQSYFSDVLYFEVSSVSKGCTITI